MVEEYTQEVEKRALLDRSEYNKVKGKLEELGASYNGIAHVKDVYFCKKDAKSFSEVEMNDIGSFSLRLRGQRNGNMGPAEATMNVKIITKEGDHNSWEEHETGIESIDEASAIFKAIGFKPFCTIEKDRSKYVLDGTNILLEDIEDFGLGVEAEIITNKEDSDAAKEKIDKVLAKIGISKSDIVEKSITNRIMKEKSYF
ncbi:CYTH-like superfamily phosphatase [Candidatus Mancarchaeum acidiphilum]|uniref:CYTH-like superfamily phosphatase n=1 Tax=Candidatus Mancarchaeum acidiphilum TaxID=1920749 RepID=A0A218NMC7_9ARCH|nr:CYTH domain-containing protein [Candidatus Mancarchaeum acidiphilum]ASI13620.1 CYTH-like superfamily phosphatase [Candidatus Mancarchaeum acidiphilum]